MHQVRFLDSNYWMRYCVYTGMALKTASYDYKKKLMHLP